MAARSYGADVGGGGGIANEPAPDNGSGNGNGLAYCNSGEALVLPPLTLLEADDIRTTGGGGPYGPGAP